MWFFVVILCVPMICSGLLTRTDRQNLDRNITDIDNSNITEDSLGVKKLHLNRKGNSSFAKNLLKYLNDVWLSLDTTRHDSLRKISKNSVKENTTEVKSQANLSKIPINSNLPFNNDANDDKHTNTLTNHEKNTQKNMFVRY